MGPIALLEPRFRGLRNRWLRAPSGQRTRDSLFVFMGLAFWVGLFVGMVFGLGAFHDVEIFGPLILRKLMELLLVSLFGMLLFSNVVTALSSFYLSDDLELLLSLPVHPATFFYTRLLETLGQSSLAMLFFGVPVFLAYGVVSEAHWVYYALLVVVVPCFLAIPASVGVIVASILVNAFSPKRVREVMVFAGLCFLIVLFILLRVLEPERLVNPQDFENLAAYIASLQAPVPPLLPPRWAAEVLDAAVRERPIPLVSLGMLVSGTVAMAGVSRWYTTRVFADGWTRSQEAKAPRMAGSRTLDAVLDLLFGRMPAPYRAVVIKDIKIFIRDPSQWSQLSLLVSLIVIYLYSVNALPTDIVRGPYMQSFKNGLAFLNLGTAGFVMASIAARFQFAVVSGEGRAFWMLRSSPLDAERYLWAKAIPGMVPMLFVGEILIVASNVLLSSPPALTVIGGITALGLAFGISGISMGMGATYPDFKADNIARAGASSEAMLCMVTSLFLVAAVVALEVPPVWFLLRADFREAGLTDAEAGISAICFALAAGLCGLATLWPPRWAARGLWARNL